MDELMMRLAGFGFTPPLKSGTKRGSSVPEARPIYVDDEGNRFALVPDDAGVTKQPYSLNRSTDGARPASNDMPTGFVAADRMPQASSDDGASELIGGMLQQLPTDMATDWLGPAAMKAMLAGGCGGMGDSAFAAMGLNNPLASGPVAEALGTALDQAGLSELNSCMPSLGTAIMGGSSAGLANAMGRQGMNSLLCAAGLDQIPGSGFVANALGDQAGAQLQDIFTGGLDDLSDSLSKSLSGISVDSMLADAESAINGIDPAAVQSAGVDMAADQLLSEWKVDDESSAVEHIANKVVKDNMEHLKRAAKDPSGFTKKLYEFFNGVSPGTGQPAVRIGDLDDGADASAMGVATILFQGSPVSRLTDLVAGPKAPAPGKKIIIGEPTVLSGNLPTAFLGAMTAVPTLMARGAPTVLVGGAVAAAAQSMLADKAKTAANLGSLSSADAGSSQSAHDIDMSKAEYMMTVTVTDAFGNEMSVPVKVFKSDDPNAPFGIYQPGVIYINENQCNRGWFGLGPPEISRNGQITLANEVQHARDDAYDGFNGRYHDSDRGYDFSKGSDGYGPELSYLEREARSDVASAEAAERMGWLGSVKANAHRESAAAMRAADQYLRDAALATDFVQQTELVEKARAAAAHNQRATSYVERGIRLMDMTKPTSDSVGRSGVD